jgi:4-methylaminobutanoate oxidase (formaldehyde-forming)
MVETLGIDAAAMRLPDGRGEMLETRSVYVSDVTSMYACFGIWGPAAREILQPLTKTSLANDSFRYMTAQELTMGDVPCLAVRVTYVGELGWELYCPTEYGLALWDSLWEAGRGHGLVAGGYRAIDSLRLEKGYRAWAADITPETTPKQAGVAFAVKLDKGDFLGRDALLAADGASSERLVCLALDDPRAIALGSEPVREAGGPVLGRVTSGGYGYAVAKSIAYAYVPGSHAEPGTALEVDIFGEWVSARVEREPLYDPEGRRIRA